MEIPTKSSSPSENPSSQAIIIHPTANLPPSLQFCLSDFADWGGFQNRFSQFSLASPAQQTPLSDNLAVPLLAIDIDDIPLIYLLPRKARPWPKFISHSPIQISDDTPSPERVAPLGFPRVPLTRTRKRQEEESLQKALLSSKKLKPLPVSSSISSLHRNDLLLRNVRKNVVRQSIVPKPPNPSPKKPSGSSVSGQSLSTRKSSRSKKRVSQPGSSAGCAFEATTSNPAPKNKAKPIPFDPTDPDFQSLIHFQKRPLIRGRVITGFGGPDMITLLAKLEVQGWTQLFLQGSTQRKFAKPEMYEFYGRGVGHESLFSSSVRGKSIHLVAEDVARILGIPATGWDHYVKHVWPPLDKLASALDISRKFSGDPTLSRHKRVLRSDMSSLHRLYFDVVHKILVPRKERRSEANYYDLTLMELLDTEVPINLPSLIIQHMQRVLIQDANGHALPYGFWLSDIFDAYSVPVQVWTLQTTKDVLGRVNHAVLPVSMRRMDTPLQKMKVALDAKEAELTTAQAAFAIEKAALSSRIAELEATLAKERADPGHYP